MRLLALPEGPGLVERWAAERADEGSAYEALYRAVMAHWPHAPGEAHAAARRAIDSARSGLPAGDEAFLRHLEANTLLAVGRVTDALPVYRRAWDAFRRTGNREEAGRVTIGWAFACAANGDPRAAAQVVARGRRVIRATDTVARARLENNLGTAWHLTGKLEPAAKQYRRAGNALRRAGEHGMAGACLFNLALVEILTGDFRRARRDLVSARDAMRRAGATLHRLYAEVGLAELDLHEGAWDRGVGSIRKLEERFRELGDERAVAWLHRELARLFTSIGAREAAEPEAAAARRAFTRLGVAPEAANVAFLEGRLAMAAGATQDAFARFGEARAHWEGAGNDRARHRANLEQARVVLADGKPEEALASLAATRRYLSRVDRWGDGALGRAVAAECHLAAGRAAQALPLARRAHREARRHPANLERPHLAIVVARAWAACDRARETVRWARKAVDELERLLLRFGRRHLRALAGGSRDPVYQEAVDLVLEHGGPGAEAIAVDLLAKARSPNLIEDLLHARADRLTDETRATIMRLRDELLTGKGDAAEDTRNRTLGGRIRRLEQRLEAGGRRPPTIVREALERRGLASWRARLGAREVVLFDRGAGGWRAFVVGARGPVRHAALPGLDSALRDAWLPLRITLETAAHVPAERRGEFLDRTRSECVASFETLREAIWRPLPLESGEVVVVPWGDLHSLPIEALSERRTVSRLPHPALLRTDPVRRRRDALLLHGGTEGSSREVREVGRQLRQAGWRVRSGRRRRLLAGGRDRLGVLHVASHGSFHRDGWLLSGLQLSDGWLGFEQLRRRQLSGALLQFTSCESGQSRAMPGSDLDGWITAGLAAGAREMVLTLWKIDDEAATGFSRAFYGHWTGGATAVEACGRARRELAAGEPHPFRWGAFVAVG